jgi:hypothetical protein
MRIHRLFVDSDAKRLLAYLSGILPEAAQTPLQIYEPLCVRVWWIIRATALA